MLKAHHVAGYLVAGLLGGLVLAGVAGGFVLAGVTPLAQGCSQNKPGQVALLGEGGCRTADGGSGTHTTISAVSFDQCKEKCLAGNDLCTAFEYNINNSGCEIHSDPIISFEQITGVSCYHRQ